MAWCTEVFFVVHKVMDFKADWSFQVFCSASHLASFRTQFIFILGTSIYPTSISMQFLHYDTFYDQKVPPKPWYRLLHCSACFFALLDMPFLPFLMALLVVTPAQNPILYRFYTIGGCLYNQVCFGYYVHATDRNTSISAVQHLKCDKMFSHIRKCAVVVVQQLTSVKRSRTSKSWINWGPISHKLSRVGQSYSNKSLHAAINVYLPQSDIQIVKKINVEFC